jgi:hypothetical protein
VTEAETRANVLRRLLVQTLDVLGFGTFFAYHDVEANLFALIQRLESNPDNCRVMYEDIWTGILNDETKPMPVIEPFYSATGHSFPLPKV